MLKTLIVAGGLVLAGVTVGGTKAYVDSKAGPGTFSEGINYGMNSSGELFGETLSIVPKGVAAAKPAVDQLRAQTSGFLGGPSSTAPQGRSDMVDPSQQTPQGGQQ